MMKRVCSYMVEITCRNKECPNSEYDCPKDPEFNCECMCDCTYAEYLECIQNI